MNKIQEINDVCKEVLTILAYFNENLIEQIPNKTLQKLNEFAANSNMSFYIDIEKDLNEQKISEESKDFIALLYYSYIANEEEKKELSRKWNENEHNFQNELYQKFNPDDIFKRENNMQQDTKTMFPENNNTALIEYKESFFTKFKNFIFKILHINKSDI